MARFLGVVLERRSYVALIYVFARLPIAWAYAAILFVGLASGISTFFAGIGVLILLLLLLVFVRGCAVFERGLAGWWFGVIEVAPRWHLSYQRSGSGRTASGDLNGGGPAIALTSASGRIRVD